MPFDADEIGVVDGTKSGYPMTTDDRRWTMMDDQASWSMVNGLPSTPSTPPTPIEDQTTCLEFYCAIFVWCLKEVWRYARRS